MKKDQQILASISIHGKKRFYVNLVTLEVFLGWMPVWMKMFLSVLYRSIDWLYRPMTVNVQLINRYIIVIMPHFYWVVCFSMFTSQYDLIQVPLIRLLLPLTTVLLLGRCGVQHKEAIEVILAVWAIHKMCFLLTLDPYLKYRHAANAKNRESKQYPCSFYTFRWDVNRP